MGKFIAVVGNPNVGKTTLFNALTGLEHTTANYPGVTIERKVGRMYLNGEVVNLVDLPGTYSLSARSPDEIIVADVLLNQQVGEEFIDGILAVVDTTNIERNLYLVTQLLELHKPIILALNMWDVAQRMGVKVDSDKLSKLLKVPAVPVCARTGMGIEELKEKIKLLVHGQIPPGEPIVNFPVPLEDQVNVLWEKINNHTSSLGRNISRFETFRILVDRGGYAEKRLIKALGKEFLKVLETCRSNAAPNGNVNAEESISRFRTIRHILSQCTQVTDTKVDHSTDRLDNILTHPVWGFLIFFIVMAVIFQSIYNLAAPIVDLIDKGLNGLSEVINYLLPEGALHSLIIDGCVAGVGSVLAFLPQIIILTFFIALLEDCGYMARAAYLMDRFLFRCGLSGQSFIPLLTSFACAIPGIMATRTISDRRDRFTTILIAPLISCSARLPVYSVMIAAFVPNKNLIWGVVRLQGITLLLMYSLGIILSIPMAWLFKKTVLRGTTPPFLLELPTYQLPLPRNVLLKVYKQAKEFLKRAGTLIFSVTVITWALAYFPNIPPTVTQQIENQREKLYTQNLPEEELTLQLEKLERLSKRARLENSFLGRIGKKLEFLFLPLGWDWRIGVATLSSFPAREVVVATLGIIFNLENPDSTEEEGLINALRLAQRPDGSPLFTVPVALSLMVFFALCCQCGGTLIIIYRETNSWLWPTLTFGYMTILAYLGAFFVFHIGRLILG